MKKTLKFPKEIKNLRKPSKATLTKLLSKVVCKQAKGICWICGKTGTQACHIFSKKAYPKSRWDYTNNVRWGCYTCHKGGNHSMHEDPEWFRQWYDNKFGTGSMDKLKTMVCLEEITTKKVDPFAVRMELEYILKEEEK